MIHSSKSICWRSSPIDLSSYTIEVITDKEEVLKLREDWDHLSCAVENPNVFMTYGWFIAWYKFLDERLSSTNCRPNILVLRKDGIVTGIAPFVISYVSRFGCSFRRLQFVMRELEWDYNDLVLGLDDTAQSEAVVNFLNHNRNNWELIELRSLRETRNAIEIIKNALTNAQLPYRVFPEEEGCPYMTIDSPWSEVLGRRSSSTRHTFRNLQSRLKRLAGDGLSTRIIENPQMESSLLDKMIEVEAQKTVAGKPSPPFIGRYKDVFRPVFDRLGSQGWIRIAVMEIGERLIAWHLLFRCGKKLWGYMTAYDSEFARYSPGTMLISTIVDYAFTHGFTEYDFLSGEEPYKMQWVVGSHRTHRLLIWNRRWRSRIFASIYRQLRVKSSFRNGANENIGQDKRSHDESIVPKETNAVIKNSHTGAMN